MKEIDLLRTVPGITVIDFCSRDSIYAHSVTYKIEDIFDLRLILCLLSIGNRDGAYHKNYGKHH
jgi:hypothetical protein